MNEQAFSIPYSVRVADLSYGGNRGTAHVSYAAALYYFQDARIAYLAHLGPFAERDIGDGCGFLVSEAMVRYHAEMFLSDPLHIAVSIKELRQSSLTMTYRIEREGTLTVAGETILVCFDYAARRPRRIPGEFRRAVLRWESALGMVEV